MHFECAGGVPSRSGAHVQNVAISPGEEEASLASWLAADAANTADASGTAGYGSNAAGEHVCSQQSDCKLSCSS